MSADPGDDPHVRPLLGAYVLDALDPAETCRVARHLRGCDGCTRDYVEVAEASALLALLQAEDLRE
ncbi:MULTISPECIES: zf-HC2 domain-containing protein [Streptomyces]|uniref:zf-HC2 domain-containing protein n=1 Tax=Streptomyces TaxID=1883 RepID=UPI001F3A3573|nr:MULTISPECIES: zf-HC2 domain-containing protein [Streptomyces]MCF3167272.1 zf-HC2 domain-containing protein [Streptomyces violaceoruber]MDW4897162.1 zf-HC2 domain-containing protein [Streptomyces californicus]